MVCDYLQKQVSADHFYFEELGEKLSLKFSGFLVHSECPEGKERIWKLSVCVNSKSRFHQSTHY
jgi:hypothetical protein